jgi:hypothetical protein
MQVSHIGLEASDILGVLVNDEGQLIQAKVKVYQFGLDILPLDT